MMSDIMREHNFYEDYNGKNIGGKGWEIFFTALTQVKQITTSCYLSPHRQNQAKVLIGQFSGPIKTSL